MNNVYNDEHVVTEQEVASAAMKLKSKKPDGEKGLWSNHIKFGSKLLFKNISSVMTAMYVHGINTYDLLCATIVSLPKDKLGDFSDSSNYRGIALISALCKICDICMLDRYKKYLYNLIFNFLLKRITQL